MIQQYNLPKDPVFFCLFIGRAITYNSLSLLPLDIRFLRKCTCWAV